MLNIYIRDLFSTIYIKNEIISTLATEFLTLKSILNKIILTVTKYLLLCLIDKSDLLIKEQYLERCLLNTTNTRTRRCVKCF